MTVVRRLAIGSIERREALGLALYALPASLLMIAVFGAPLAIILRQSVTDRMGQLSLEPFARIFSQEMFAQVAWNTLQISLSATACSLALAYPLAYYLASRTPRRRALLTVLVLVPFWTSALVKSFAFVVLLGHDGVVNTLLGYVGLAPLDLLFNRLGVIIGMSHYLVCFMLFPILSNLLAQPTDLRRAAAIMGAGKWLIFWRVTVPLSLPGVLAGALLVFILSLGFYIMPALLGGLHDMMLSNLVDFYTNETIDWPMASAISVILSLVAGLAASGLLLVPGGGGIFGDEPSR